MVARVIGCGGQERLRERVHGLGPMTGKWRGWVREADSSGRPRAQARYGDGLHTTCGGGLGGVQAPVVAMGCELAMRPRWGASSDVASPLGLGPILGTSPPHCICSAKLFSVAIMFASASSFEQRPF